MTRISNKTAAQKTVEAMSKNDWLARAEACNSAASHLELDWTDNPMEREQGKVIVRMLRKAEMACQREADRLL